MATNMVNALDEVTGDEFRRVMSSYPTGVAVISAVAPDGEALGMTVGSFSSVSLEPPLVSFMADVNSSSWAALQKTDGRFCVNVLSAEQEGECRTIATRKKEKFDGLAWMPGATGLPVLTGSVAIIECSLEVVHRAGDHDIVIGRVRTVDSVDGRLPLLFFRGGYGSFRPRSVLATQQMLPAHLSAVETVRPVLDRLAARSGARVSITAVTGHELMVLATAGWGDGSGGWVGQRLPFVPPVGSVHAAWGSDELRAGWLHAADGVTGVPSGEELLSWLETIRQRGYALALGHRAMGDFPGIVAQVNEGDTDGAARRLVEVAGESFEACYPERLPEVGEVEFRSATVPLEHPGGVLGLSIWGGPGAVPISVVGTQLDLLRECSREARSLLSQQV